MIFTLKPSKLPNLKQLRISLNKLADAIENIRRKLQSQVTTRLKAIGIARCNLTEHDNNKAN